jgi:hypothetical protein
MGIQFTAGCQQFVLFTVRAEFSRENAMTQEFYRAAEQTSINTGVLIPTFRKT